MALQLPPCPDSLKGIQHFLNIASEHDNRDLAISYWCRLHALQRALTIDKSSDGAKLVLLKLMDWLEHEKKSHRDNDTIMNETAAQAYIENYALKLFQWADAMDRASTFNKNVVKAFYTASILMEVLQIFGELSEDIVQNKKYAKWKAAYIHNCLKNGETPIPGPPEGEEGPVGGSNEFSLDASGVQFPEPTKDSSEDFKPANPEPSISFPAPSASGGFLPSPPGKQENPSGPAFPPQSPSQPSIPLPVAQPEQDIPHLEADLVNKCQKLIKFASSALNYDDYKEAKSNLVKALNILNTGRDTKL